MEIKSVDVYGWGAMATVETDIGSFQLSRWSYDDHLLISRIAKRYIGKEIPVALCESIKRTRRAKRGIFLPKMVERPPREETSTTDLFEEHRKSVPLDLVVFEGRWEVSLREEKRYSSGHHSCSRIYITSILEVRDRDTGKIGIVREKITPNDDGPNRFYLHLGDAVLAIRVKSVNEIGVKTRFGSHTKIRSVSLHSPNS